MSFVRGSILRRAAASMITTHNPHVIARMHRQAKRGWHRLSARERGRMRRRIERNLGRGISPYHDVSRLRRLAGVAA